MRLLNTIMLSAALVAITGCGTGQNQIVGKWDCKFDGTDYSSGQKDTFEYLADGTTIISSIYSSKVNLPPSQITGQWKSLDGNRISSTFDEKTNVTTYKFEGEKLLFKSASSEEYPVKCDRVK